MDDLDFIPPSHEPERKPNVRALWRTMESRIATQDSLPSRPSTPPLGRPGWLSRYRHVLAVTGIAAIVTIVAVPLLRDKTPAASPQQVTYSTQPGQQATITLADGSIAELAPGTTVDMDYAPGTHRRLTLSGEAIFSVHPNSTAPFTVQAGDGIVKVLGTEFSVRHYAEDSVMRVAVVSGRVSLRSAFDHTSVGATLGASDMAELRPHNRVYIARGESLDDVLSWRHGRLVFRNQPVSQVLRELSRRYDLDITMADSSLASITITSTFTQSSSQELLDVLSLLLSVDVDRNGRSVTLVPRTGQ